MAAFFRSGPFGMGNAAARRHPVDIAGGNHLVRAQRITVGDFAVEKIGHRGQADMWVRADIHPLADAQFRRAHMIEKNKRPDHAVRPVGEQAMDPERTDIGLARGNGQFDQGH